LNSIGGLAKTPNMHACILLRSVPAVFPTNL
jgi:hypothetical protein